MPEELLSLYLEHKCNECALGLSRLSLPHVTLNEIPIDTCESWWMKGKVPWRFNVFGQGRNRVALTSHERFSAQDINSQPQFQCAPLYLPTSARTRGRPWRSSQSTIDALNCAVQAPAGHIVTNSSSQPWASQQASYVYHDYICPFDM